MFKKSTNENPERQIDKLKIAESELNEVEKVIQKCKDRYRKVLDDLPGLICSFLPGYKITFVNKAYCEYFDKTFEDLIGLNFLTLIPEADRKRVIANISALKSESPKQTHEHQVMAPSGDIRWHRWTNRAIFDTQGKVCHYQSSEKISPRASSQKRN